MFSPRWLIICAALYGALTAAVAAERQLAGIQLDMKPKQVIDILGDPTAIIIAQPPTSGPAAGSPLGPGGMPGGMRSPSGMPMAGGFPGAGMPGAAAPADAPNTLVFLYKDQEIELNDAAPAPGPMPMPGMAAGRSATRGAASSLPIWAYTVRVSKLALDQQQLIYKINSTYSLGITVTGQGAEAHVTDIVACSFEPFTYSNNSKKLVAKKPNFLYAAAPTGIAKRFIPAGTSKGVLIGSHLADVLKAHRWPEGFLPFVPDMVAAIPLNGKMPSLNELQNRPAVAGGAGSAAGSITGPGGMKLFKGPDGRLYGPNGPVPDSMLQGMMPGAMAGPSGMPSAPGAPGASSAPGAGAGSDYIRSDGTVNVSQIKTAMPGFPEVKPSAKLTASFDDNAGTHLTIPFTDSCELVYPDDHVAITVVNSTVVRIHIGRGVLKPESAIPTSTASPGRR